MMGCCGCDNKTSVKTAAICGMIQSIVGIGLHGHFLRIYYGDSNTLEEAFLVFRTLEYHKEIRGLLLTSAFLLSVWLLSSIALYIGNRGNNATLVGQWLPFTFLVIIGDVIFPAVFIYSTWAILSEDTQPFSKKMGFYNKFILLLMSFVKLAVITISINIALCVYTKRHLKELQFQIPLSQLRTTYGAFGPSHTRTQSSNPDYTQEPFIPNGSEPPSAPPPDYPQEAPPSYFDSQAKVPHFEPEQERQKLLQ